MAALFAIRGVPSGGTAGLPTGSPPYLRIFGIGAGNRAVGSVAIDQVRFWPQSIRLRQKEAARYSFHAHTDFDRVKAEFLKAVFARGGLVAKLEDHDDVRGVARETSPSRSWSGRKAAPGEHIPQVRAWESALDMANWVIARSADQVGGRMNQPMRRAFAAAALLVAGVADVWVVNRAEPHGVAEFNPFIAKLGSEEIVLGNPVALEGLLFSHRGGRNETVEIRLDSGALSSRPKNLLNSLLKANRPVFLDSDKAQRISYTTQDLPGARGAPSRTTLEIHLSSLFSRNSSVPRRPCVVQDAPRITHRSDTPRLGR